VLSGGVIARGLPWPLACHNFAAREISRKPPFGTDGGAPDHRASRSFDVGLAVPLLRPLRIALADETEVRCRGEAAGLSILGPGFPPEMLDDVPAAPVCEANPARSASPPCS